MKTIGAIIREAREHQNLTQRELGKKIGVTDVTIGRWEKGERFPSAPRLGPLCSALGLDMSEMVNVILESPEPMPSKITATYNALLQLCRHPFKRGEFSKDEQELVDIVIHIVRGKDEQLKKMLRGILETMYSKERGHLTHR